MIQRPRMLDVLTQAAELLEDFLRVHSAVFSCASFFDPKKLTDRFSIGRLPPNGGNPAVQAF